MPNSIDFHMKKNKIIINMPLLTIFLTSCNFSYSKPITQESAKNIISYTSNAINERDYSGYSNIHLSSKLEERRMTSFIIRETVFKAQYEIDYRKDPYSLTISAEYDKNEDKKKEYDDFSLEITKDSDAYYVSVNNQEKENINNEKYKKLWQFCDFPTYTKTISQKLVTKTYELIDSVGSQNDNKTNKLTGFRTSSKGDDDLKIDYTGSEFGLGDTFFQTKYNAETATEFGIYMTGGLVSTFSSEYTFTIDEENDYYAAGTYEGIIDNSFSYTY